MVHLIIIVKNLVRMPMVLQWNLLFNQVTLILMKVESN